jgi:hypothetical protein
MGNQLTKKVSFQDIQYAQMNEHTIIINTLPENEQSILICKTVPIASEISQVENAIKLKKNIIIYGKNSNDETIYVRSKNGNTLTVTRGAYKTDNVEHVGGSGVYLISSADNSLIIAGDDFGFNG